MSGDRYFITEQHAIHFLTFTVVDWIDVFTRPAYKYIIVDALNYCSKVKGLECFAWVLMSNHMHLVARANAPFRLSDVIRDLKKFTSKKLLQAMADEGESRREWLLHKFQHAAYSTGRAEHYKLWQDSNHAVLLADAHRYRQRIDYIHQNPVRQLIVAQPEDYLFSSACDYTGMKGLVNVTVDY